MKIYHIKIYNILILFALMLGLSHKAFSWAETGHDAVTQVAVRKVLAELGNDNGLAKVFLQKQHLLSHLSNVPDIVWKESAGSVVEKNNPTHFVFLDYLTTEPVLALMPETIEQAKEIVRKNCSMNLPQYPCPEGGFDQNVMSKVGTAPWRVQQLYNVMKGSFKAISDLAASQQLTKELFEKHVNEALVAAGLMSHFVGDLGQPLHVTKDKSGWDKGQGGIHLYFEVDVVDALPPTLIMDTLSEVLSNQPSPNLLKDESDPLTLSWRLALNSFHEIPHLLELDKEYAVEIPSVINVSPAKRKNPFEVAFYFKKIIVERLALSSDLLAYLWTKAWKDGGAPALDSYKSYFYPVAPDFVEPDYL